MANIAATLVGTALVRDADRSEAFGIPIPGQTVGGTFGGASVSQNLPVDAHSNVYSAIILNGTAPYWFAFGDAGGATAAVGAAGSLLISSGSFNTVLGVPLGAETFAIIQDTAPAGANPQTAVNQTWTKPNVGVANGLFLAAVMTSAIVNPMTGTPTGGTLVNGVATMDFARTIQIVSAAADTAVVTVIGTDIYGNTIMQDLTLNGASIVYSKKAFKTVISATANGTTGNNITMGPAVLTGTAGLGLNYKLAPGFLTVGTKNVSGTVTADAGTVVQPDTAAVSNTTGDVRGVYKPAAVLAVATTSFFAAYATQSGGGNFNCTGIF